MRLIPGLSLAIFHDIFPSLIYQFIANFTPEKITHKKWNLCSCAPVAQW